MAYAVGITHLQDVRLAAARPPHLVEVVAHHPECRPQTVCRLWQQYAALYLAVFEIHLLMTIKTSRSKFLSVIVLLTCCEYQAAGSRCVVLDRYILTTVVLHLVITAAIAVNLDIPLILVECIAVELVAPHQYIAVCGS